MENLTKVDISSLKFVKFDEKTSLIPIVTQEADTGEVLMVAYANKEAVEKTNGDSLDTGVPQNPDHSAHRGLVECRFDAAPIT